MWAYTRVHAREYGGVPADINSWSNCVYPNRRRGGLLPVIIFVAKCNCIQAGQYTGNLDAISRTDYARLKIFARTRLPRLPARAI